MTKFMKALLVLAGLTVALPIHAQTLLLPTTFSAAVTSGAAKTYAVASATNCVAGNIAYADNELAVIESVVSTTLTVQRGASGTVGVPHTSGAAVVCAAPGAFSPTTFTRVDANGNPDGSCTRGNQLYLPVINPRSGTISDCIGGQWQSGSPYNSGALTSTRFRVNSPEPGAVLYTGINTTGTATIATEVYCSEVFLPSNKLLTGIALLNGTTVGTDKHYVVLYDNSGVAIANSAVAGATTAGASVLDRKSVV